jgi:hypothetical protein
MAGKGGSALGGFALGTAALAALAFGLGAVTFSALDAVGDSAFGAPGVLAALDVSLLRSGSLEAGVDAGEARAALAAGGGRVGRGSGALGDLL